MKNKGITLVALIITIIILLILAGITISQLTGSGLFENAKLAEQKSEESQDKEDETLEDYSNKIGEYVNGTRFSSDNIILLTREYAFAKNQITGGKSSTVENIALSDYGTGKAIITFSGSSSSASTGKLEVYINKNSNSIAHDADIATSGTYVRACATAIIEYNKDTTISLGMYSNSTITPYYSYSILLIKD